MSNPFLAWPTGRDPVALNRAVRAAHERFVTGEDGPQDVRPVVRESWLRSLSGGFDPERDRAPVDLLDDDLRAYREAHPLARVMPMIRRLLTEPAVDGRHLVAVTDAAGMILWIEGDHALRSRAQGMHFIEGAIWDEARAGTNAPGTALAIDHSVQIYAAEHFSRVVQPWSCSAAPIHDPMTGALLGAVDLTGGDEVAGPYAFALVQATVTAVEAELQLQRVSEAARRAGQPSVPRGRSRGRPVQVGAARLDVLGRDRCVLTRGSTGTPLSLRLSELVLVLSAHPRGISGDALAVEMYENEAAAVTLRAEITRLRRLVGELTLPSRPYRLELDVSTDVAEVRRALDHGAVGRALALYAGPVLPRSQAPGVVRIREDLRAELRTALLRTADPELLLTWAEGPDGRDDLEVWAAAVEALPLTSPRRDRARARVNRLQADLGGGPARVG